MQILLKTSSVFLLISIIFINCKKEDTLSASGISCKVNGQVWSASGSKTIAQIFQSQINISGQADDGTSITLSIESLTTGAYNLVERGIHVGTYANNNTISPYASNQGSDNFAKVVISDINTKESTMSGTFQFTGFRTSNGTKVVISDGVFRNLKFISKPNLFKCNIDGTPFSAEYVKGEISNDYLQISGFATSDFYGIRLYLQPNISVGTIRFNEAYSKNFAVMYSKGTPTVILYTNSTLLGGVTISKHDKNAKIIEGNFAFEAKELSGTKTGSISGGSFSVKY